MDLNASPLPEDDEEEQILDAPVQDEIYEEEHVETAVETLRREREERRQRLKREHPDDVASRTSAKIQKANVAFQSRNNGSNDRRKQVPSGWSDCPPYGKPIFNIIPSKVPLSEFFNDCVVPGKRYNIKRVIDKQRIAGRELGLVIDLTNTSRYYSPIDWKKQGIKHLKIACKGRDEVPDALAVNIFCYEVMQFFQRQKSKYILVHCTHGHNRTGYMIINFLVRCYGYSVTEAIEAFTAARPPGIYKPDYIDALYTLYHDKKPESFVCPPTPEWKRSSELDLNGDSIPDMDDDDGNNGISATVQEIGVTNVTMTNDDVLGDEISYDHQVDLQRVCCWALGVGNGRHFPGSQPVSLDRTSLQLLRQRYYYATWKADGTRYMMLITHDGCYLIDRKFYFRRVQMRFPLRSPAQDDRNHHHLTLLDGEMIIDTDPETGQQNRRYLVYDLMMLNHKPVIELPFCERWKLIEKEVIEPRNIERATFERERATPIHYRYEMEPFRVRRKLFWMLSAVGKLLVEFIPKLSHDADGLIFQGWDDPYVPRTHEGLLKWKYAHMNSVDFLFEVGEGDYHALYLIDKGRNKQLEGAYVVFKGGEDPMEYSGKIIECSWNPDQMCWEYMRVRVDKTTPNAWNTYTKVRKSIEDNITQTDLLNEIDEIIKLPMYADRIAKESHARHHHSHPGRRR
ncbi:uncharacterized protein LOC116260211 isoform X1 [Nymphaea colorata]|nr:uncharacterized protein LOC116260211 isoform X1 [Nymphaea colorata]XP_031494225.1 uncharacterized protein LOC116260211 isoform X1 [Nymphaea colorata]XP_031494226.1 uncharacterized protein LOC116260211 isoform X1 [Nymphaea colorata]XP_049935426.1 uncharacterized protein LOC116260211 isoform X1 [Nymphaea colorata]